MRFTIQLLSGLCLILIGVSLGHAQSDLKTPSIFELQAKESATELPSAVLPSAQQRAFGSRNNIGRTTPSGYGLSLNEKPNVPATMRLTTQIETRVENKTTNYVGGSGSVAETKGPDPVAVDPPPSSNESLWQSDFFRLVQQLVGRPVSVFGESYFSQADQFKPNEKLEVPRSYVVAAGDEITTRAWGEIDIDHTGTVGRDGTLFLPKIGSITLAGTRYGDLNENMKTAIEKSYKSFQISTSLNTTRTVTIHAVGFAKRPGSYQVSAYSRLIDAIFAVGGPTSRANYRAIRLLRDDKTIAKVDLYDFFARGNQPSNVPIQANDIIVFDATTEFAAIVGQVTAPGIFQLKSNSSLEELLRLSGGRTITSSDHRILLERLDDNQRRVASWLTIGSNVATHHVKSGDIYSILPLSPKLSNVVTLKGQVAMPLRQPWLPGLRISDLIPSADFLINPHQWVRANERSSPDRLAQSNSKPDTTTQAPSIHWEYASIERINAITLETSVVAFNLRLAVIGKDPTHDLILEPGDIITVYGKDDLRVSSSQKVRHVRVEGEVAAAGIYAVEEDFTLADLINRAGGATGAAYLYGIELTRETTRESQQARMTQAIDRLEQDMHRATASRVRNSLSADQASASGFEADSLRQLVSDRKSTRLNSSHVSQSRMPSSA